MNEINKAFEKFEKEKLKLKCEIAEEVRKSIRQSNQKCEHPNHEIKTKMWFIYDIIERTINKTENQLKSEIQEIVDKDYVNKEKIWERVKELKKGIEDFKNKFPNESKVTLQVAINLAEDRIKELNSLVGGK